MSSTVGSNRNTDEALMCRFCHGSSNEDLLSPCRCKGTLARVHRSCLETWIRQSIRKECEICMTPYVIQRAMPKSLIDWLRDLTCLDEDRRDDNMFIHCIRLPIRVLILVLNFWLCIICAEFLSENSDHFMEESYAIELIIVFTEVILDSLAIIILILLLAATASFIGAGWYHFAVWIWRK